MIFSSALVFFLILETQARNSTYRNPILPGFHPDPSCIFIADWDDTFFCASSSFLVFPGIPIHASRDLQKWKLISNALSRPTQVPGIDTAKRATSGIWASTIRYREGTFYVVTSLVYDDYPKNATNRFDSFIITSKNPYNSASWSDPIHFNFSGYDTSPFWDDDGTLYITGTHAWEVEPGIQMITLDMQDGRVGNEVNIWNGTGASAPEGPHLYKKDGYYYLIIAEGGTGPGHMATMARSKSITGPYDPHPHNPVLTNANSTQYFQNVGHVDLFQDANDNWWAVALSVRQGPDGSYPMGRETSLTPVTWNKGEWPIFQNVTGHMSGWYPEPKNPVEGGEGSLIGSAAHVDFASESSLGPEFVHWRVRVDGSYVISAPGHANSLQLSSSLSNLTGRDGRSAEPGGQTFISRRQVHSLFSFSATLDISSLRSYEAEVGVSVFLDQLHHWDLGIVMGSLASPPKTSGYGGPASNSTTLVPYLRLRGITTVPTFVFPDLHIVPFPTGWSGQKITLQITASNITHYTFSAGPAGQESLMQHIGTAPGLGLTWGFTGTLLGVYATTNGGLGKFKTYVSDWEYVPQGQVVD
ncbi:beta-xylosidase [Clohesyomyces aquaticus]|uniref:Beta-xylosidase n=1 Tax=Clohesyomyces aquaticus TaxID=1231657 RepID=A0A1Y1XZ62_9PLEO|nr:beta-xylosidase [Clohesyomyces aquaticus]